MPTRVKIPHKTEVKVLVKNKHICCVCRELRSSQEVQIHHINGNPSNNIQDNLAVLCVYHHNLANIGLKKGEIGSGKKITPDEVKKYKSDWERRVESEINVKRKIIPSYRRKQLEVLYEFEISKRKNEILALLQKEEQARKDNYEFLQQLVVEEFVSGLRLRPVLLKAFSDIAFQSIGQSYIALPLVDAIRGLFLHLIGPPDVKINSEDKKLLLQSLDQLQTLGMYGAEFSEDSRSKLLRKVCDTVYELAEICSWYHFSDFLTKSRKVLNSIKKDCPKLEPVQKRKYKEKLIKGRVKIVEDTIKFIEKLKRSSSRF